MGEPDPDGDLVVLVVDDHPIVRRGLRLLLEDQPWVRAVVEAGDGDEAVRLAVLHSVDVVAMDLNLPGLSGLEATQQILRARPGVAILVLTMSRDEAEVGRALRGGARGYLVKDTDPEVVADALHVVARGVAVLGPGVDVAPIGTTPAGPGLKPPLDQLTERERGVLAALAEGRTNGQIGRQLGISEKTVRNHLSSVFLKLGVADRVQAALVARDAGLG